MEREEIQKRLKKELDKNRYEHTLGVMYTAGSLAMAYGYDYEKAMIAGLLHDCAKCLPTEKKISLCEKNDILISRTSPCKSRYGFGRGSIWSKGPADPSCHQGAYNRRAGYEYIG